MWPPGSFTSGTPPAVPGSALTVRSSVDGVAFNDASRSTLGSITFASPSCAVPSRLTCSAGLFSGSIALGRSAACCCWLGGGWPLASCRRALLLGLHSSQNQSPSGISFNFGVQQYMWYPSSQPSQSNMFSSSSILLQTTHAASSTSKAAVSAKDAAWSLCTSMSFAIDDRPDPSRRCCSCLAESDGWPLFVRSRRLVGNGNIA